MLKKIIFASILVFFNNFHAAEEASPLLKGTVINKTGQEIYEFEIQTNPQSRASVTPLAINNFAKDQSRDFQFNVKPSKYGYYIDFYSRDRFGGRKVIDYHFDGLALTRLLNASPITLEITPEGIPVLDDLLKPKREQKKQLAAKESSDKTIKKLKQELKAAHARIKDLENENAKLRAMLEAPRKGHLL
ncbi:MAG TPA: hypothetical protein VFF04_06305 [Candidatus Babeliales bacterium]|nr:hypothetical protein [Candidatus Babeliales bacterium]